MPAPFPAEALITNARALRGLARTLCADDSSADDVVQTAVARALEHPPRSAPSLRAWLARVMTNEARAIRRGDDRRRRREHHAATSEVISDTADLSARHEERVELIRAVRTLHEPYREAVLLRFFEDLPPRRIAEHLGVPVKTIDSRLQRAVALLRGRLDARHGGDRRTWTAALAPLAGPSASPATLTGVLLMNAKLAFAGLLAVTVATWWMVERTGEDAPSVPAHATAAPSYVDAPAPPERTVAPAVERAAESVADRRPPVAAVAPTPIRARVVDPRGASLVGVRVIATSADGPPRDGTSDGGGMVTFTLEGFRITLEVDDPGYVGVLDAIVTGGSDLADEFVVVAAPRTLVAGRVLDSAGTPVDEADVSLTLPDTVRAQLPFDLRRTRAREWAANTGADGTFRFTGAPAVAGLSISAKRVGLEPDSARPTTFPAPSVRLTLGRPARTAVLEGVVFGPDGAPLEEVGVALGMMPATTDALGRFRFEYDASSPPARLMAVAKGRLPAVRERGEAPWPPTVELHLTEEPFVLAGVVRSVDGQPLADATVWIDEPTVFASWDDGFWAAETVIRGGGELQQRTVTDEAGRFRLEGLVDREYGLLAMDSALAWKIDAGRFQAGDESVEIRFPAEGIHRRLAGRVLDRFGRPLAGVQCQVETLMLAARDPKTGIEYNNVQTGATATTGADGRFVLRDVPIERSTLDLSGAGLAAEQPFRIPGTLPEELVLRVALACGLRVDRPAAAYAASFRLLDGEGRIVSCVRRTHGRISYLKDAPLSDGRSEVFSAADAAEFLLLLDADGEELERLPIELAPGELTVIR